MHSEWDRSWNSVCQYCSPKNYCQYWSQCQCTLQELGYSLNCQQKGLELFMNWDLCKGSKYQYWPVTDALFQTLLCALHTRRCPGPPPAATVEDAAAQPCSTVLLSQDTGVNKPFPISPPHNSNILVQITAIHDHSCHRQLPINATEPYSHTPLDSTSLAEN